MDNLGKANSTLFRIVYILKRCIFLICSFKKSYMIITVLVTVIQGIIPALSMIIMQHIINMLQTSTQSISSFMIFIVSYVMLEVIESIISSTYGYYSFKFNEKFDKYVKLLLLQKASSLRLCDFEDAETYNIINRAQNQGGQGILSFFNSFISMLKLFVTASSSLLILSTYNLWMVGIVLIIPIIKYLYSLKIGKEQYKIQIERTSKERESWYITHLILTGNAFKEIKLYGLKSYFISKFDKLMENIIDQDVKLVKKATKINATLDFLDQIIFGSIFFYLIMEGVHHSILIGDVITYTKRISTVKSNMETIFSLFSTVAKQSLFIRLFFQFLDIKTSSEDENKKIELNQIKTIEFKDVCFKYKNNDNYVLENINFKIDNNHIIGIVGRNGSGKSTLSKLILGFYDDYEGEILVNGVDLKNLNKISYCKQIGCVFQDYVKYETSLRENIAFGNLRILNNDNIINNALNFVQLKANIYSKEGLDVCLGNWFGGKQVSIGEWQKISIARTLVKDADLYVMDEPDSSLDAESELEMLQSYSKVFQNKLGIFISHKISQLKLLTDDILVIDQGKIVERGCHDELMKLQGVYHSLYTKQNTHLMLKNSRSHDD